MKYRHLIIIFTFLFIGKTQAIEKLPPEILLHVFIECIENSNNYQEMFVNLGNLQQTSKWFYRVAQHNLITHALVNKNEKIHQNQLPLKLFREINILTSRSSTDTTKKIIQNLSNEKTIETILPCDQISCKQAIWVIKKIKIDNFSPQAKCMLTSKIIRFINEQNTSLSAMQEFVHTLDVTQNTADIPTISSVYTDKIINAMSAHMSCLEALHMIRDSKVADDYFCVQSRLVQALHFKVVSCIHNPQQSITGAIQELENLRAHDTKKLLEYQKLQSAVKEKIRIKILDPSKSYKDVSTMVEQLNTQDNKAFIDIDELERLLIQKKENDPEHS